ncbi:unnamed protein product [Phaedon cochleariae]|uniref:receptor protein-tyrosine kinase n=1 Tax=Phaedon cochleariae TaxID=80249 RepID=A0A9P0GXC3_PHACE|nr:unnamed protein product [Phaedon cochleariae]
MYWSSCVGLLSFAFLLIEVRCQRFGDNTPPSIWLDSRNWQLRENETVGSRVAQAHGDDPDGVPLVFGLEPYEFYGAGGRGGRPPPRLPFRIDNETGTVYLNESLQGRAGQNLHFWVTVSDGQLPAKTEVNVNIIPSRSRYSTSVANRPPIFQNPSFPRLPPMPHPQPVASMNQNPLVNYPSLNQPPLVNYPSFVPKQSYNGNSYGQHQGPAGGKPAVMPQPVRPEAPGTRTTTILKPVPVETKPADTPSTKAPTTSTHKPVGIEPEAVDNDIEERKKVLELNKTMKPPEEVAATVIPIVSIIAVFLTIGILAVIFRKKLHLGKPKDTKEDMRKDSSGMVISDATGLDLNEWRGPRAFSNRYEPWQTDYNHTQLENQISAPVKNTDRWEFPRHRLKFFNILGEGAFGQVWKCEALDLDGKDTGVTVVAVKTLKENANEKEKSDLLTELQVMKMLEPHANVVRLLGCCTEKEPIFLVMEYVSMGKLQSYLRSSRAERYYNNMHGQSRSLTSRDLTSFVYQVAKGMEYLYEIGIIHRDLAARNILITEEHTCKVADFGFARDVIASHVYERKSEGRLPIRWMAPESLYDNIFTVKSDVWSFGVLIWEVVTLGSTPYPGMSAVEVMKKVRDGYRLDKPEHCRRELYNIMYYCWDKDPKERPSFCECVELLEKLLLSETDYIELERFPDHSYYNMMGMSGEKL